MTRVGSGAFIVILAILSTTVPMATADEERNLFVQLPLHLDGETQADAVQSILRLAARDGVAPRITQADVSFTAMSATARITNWTQYSSPADGTVPTDLLFRDTGGSTSKEYPDPIEVRIHDLGSEMLILAHDGPMEGARYAAIAEDKRTHMDVTTERSFLSYTEIPEGLDYKRDVDKGTFMLSGDDMLFTVQGDFELFVFDATVQIVTASGGSSGTTITTGRWTETQDGNGALPDDAAVTSTTVQYVRLHLQDAEFALRVSGGDQALYSGAEDVAIAIDGAITTSGAVGSMKVNDQNVRSTGERMRLTGSFMLVPTASESGDARWGFFALTGEVDTLSVGRATYVSKNEVVAATGMALLLAAVGLYFLPVIKSGLVVPLYAKLSKDKVLDQETRNLIHAKVEQDPGCQVNDVADSLAISWTTASYHLRVLRKMGLIVSRRRGRHEHFFVPGSPQTATYALASSLKNDTAKQIVAAVLRHPGIIQKELCESLSIAPSTASWHIKRLIDSDVLTEARDWKMRRYYAGAALAQVPIHLGPIEIREAALLTGA